MAKRRRQRSSEALAGDSASANPSPLPSMTGSVVREESMTPGSMEPEASDLAHRGEIVDDLVPVFELLWQWELERRRADQRLK